MPPGSHFAPAGQGGRASFAALWPAQFGGQWGRIRGWLLTETMVKGSHVPRLAWLAVVLVCGGQMAGRFDMAMWTRVCSGLCCVAASVVAVCAGGGGAPNTLDVGFR